MPNLNISLNDQDQYGPIKIGFTLDSRSGYNVLVGENDIGKSAILQLAFRQAIRSLGRDKVCYIPPDRDHVEITTETGSRSLVDYNGTLYDGVLNGGPVQYGSGEMGGRRSELPRLLLTHSDFIEQVNKVNEYSKKLDLPLLRIPARQTPTFQDIALHYHGTGLRSIFFILTALSNTDEKLPLILIDEPERSLEPKLQKKLRDLLLAITGNKIIIVATHSHLFLNRDEPKRNKVVTSSSEGQVVLQEVENQEQLMNITFELLGNSTQDLFFPENFLIVEGASDQIICEKVANLMGISPLNVKILSATGVTKTPGLVLSIENALRPLIADYSPYAGRIVTLFDAPNEETSRIIASVRESLGEERCFVLPKKSMEEYIPKEIFSRAGLDKDTVLAELENLKNDFDKLARRKNEVSRAIAAELIDTDLDQLEAIKSALLKAGRTT